MNQNTSTPSPRWICLTGFMGSGKTTVGSALAERLGWEFVDLDAEIVKAERRPIAEIFRTHGEAHFRQVEHEALKQVLGSDRAPAVIALGGGTYVQERNRDLLRAHAARTIYLEGEFAILLERCGAEHGTRPLMRDLEKFRRLHEERQPAYRKAELIVSIGKRTPGQIADDIATKVRKWKTAVSE